MIWNTADFKFAVRNYSGGTNKWSQGSWDHSNQRIVGDSGEDWVKVLWSHEIKLFGIRATSCVWKKTILPITLPHPGHWKWAVGGATKDWGTNSLQHVCKMCGHKQKTSDLCDCQQRFCHYVLKHILQRDQILISLMKMQINLWHFSMHSSGYFSNKPTIKIIEWSLLW